MELLSPKIDVVFKALFTSADSEDILTDFLASVLDIENSDIKNIKIINTEVLPEAADQKYSRLDLAMEVDDRIINVEMQIKKLTDYRERVLFYWSKLYAKDLRESESYKSLKQTISINVLDYKMFDCEECHSVFMLRETNRGELLTDKCRFDFLELPKADSDSRQVKRLKRWLKFFNLKSEEDAEMIAQANDTVMNKAVFILKKMSADDKIREAARIRERALHDEASYLEDARNEGFEEGKTEGIEIGREKGRVEGRAEGIAEGRARILETLRALGADEELLEKAAMQ